MTSTLVGLLNLGIGFLYMQYGTMTAYEMLRGRRTLGFSHFGAAWVAMTWTCGPHHLHHGVHTLMDGRVGGPIDLAAVIVGAPAGLVWFFLRVEAFRGGRGDRFIAGTPWWVYALPAACSAYVTAIVAAWLSGPGWRWENLDTALPNLALMLVYATVTYYLWATQVANRPALGGWSASGLALAIGFPGCVAMHAVFAAYTLTGQYTLASHGLFIDVLAVPAGLYFLWVVQMLHRGTYSDWNRVRATPPLAQRPA